MNLVKASLRRVFVNEPIPDQVGDVDIAIVPDGVVLTPENLFALAARYSKLGRTLTLRESVEVLENKSPK